MSELLDTKSEAEIEEIYNRATLDDLQSMLIQEKSINRRRLLRKVMRIKQTDDVLYSKPMESLNEIHLRNNMSKDKNALYFTASKSNNNDSHKLQNLSKDEENKLEKLKIELDNTVDLVKRKLLRKEIHDLEEQYLGLTKQTSNNIQSISQPDFEPLNKFETKDNKSQNMPRNSLTIQKENDVTTKEKNVPLVEISRNSPKLQFAAENNRPKTILGVLEKDIPKYQIKSDNVEKSEKPKTNLTTKSEVAKNQNTSNSTQKMVKPLSPVQMSPKSTDTTKNICEPPKTNPVRNLSRVQSVRDRFETPKTELTSNKTTLNSTQKSVKPSSPTQLSRPSIDLIKQHPEPPPKTPVKNLSRVQSVRERFETPTREKKVENLKPTNNEELYNLVHASLKIDAGPKQSSQKTNDAQSLAVPEPRIRKTSDKNLLRLKALDFHGNSKSVLKEVLLKWIQKNTSEYKNVQISNYSKCWADGLAFCALIHHFYPNSFDYNVLSSKNPLTNFRLAFETAKKYAGIEQLLDPEDMMALDTPDEKCVYTYVQFMYNELKKHPRNMCKRSSNLSS